MIFGANFCDKFIQTIRPIDKPIELDDRTTIPIVRPGLHEHSAAQQIRRSPIARDKSKNMPSPLNGASATIPIPVQSQAWVPAHAKSHRLAVVEMDPKLVEKLELLCTNRAAQIEPNKMLRLLVSNFANEPRQVRKGQVVTTLLASLVRLVTSTRKARDLLCFAYDEQVPLES